MTPPNPRDKHIFRDGDHSGPTGSAIGIVICLMVTGALIWATMGKGYDIALLGRRPIYNTALPTAVGNTMQLDRSNHVQDEISGLRVVLPQWDQAIAEASARVTGFHEPLARMEADMRVLQATMDRLAVIGDQRGRNEVAFQFNEKVRQHNELVAEQARYVSFQKSLVEKRNGISQRINELQGR